MLMFYSYRGRHQLPPRGWPEYRHREWHPSPPQQEKLNRRLPQVTTMPIKTKSPDNRPPVKWLSLKGIFYFKKWIWIFCFYTIVKKIQYKFKKLFIVKFILVYEALIETTYWTICLVVKKLSCFIFYAKTIFMRMWLFWGGFGEGFGGDVEALTTCSF